MKLLIIFLFIFPMGYSGCGQNSPHPNIKKTKQETKVGGSCEDCDEIYNCPKSFTKLRNNDTLPGFDQPGPKIEISGIVYKKDGQTPAAGIVLYVYHTNQEGIYPKNEKEMNSKHGTIRAWLKTDAEGRYKFFTMIPASYPNSNNPKHIHAIIKEPGKTAYWIEDFLFADDPLLPKEKEIKPRGGNGILFPQKEGFHWKAERNIILGMHIPGYPN